MDKVNSRYEPPKFLFFVLQVSETQESSGFEELVEPLKYHRCVITVCHRCVTTLKFAFLPHFLMDVDFSCIT